VAGALRASCVKQGWEKQFFLEKKVFRFLSFKDFFRFLKVFLGFNVRRPDTKL